MAFPMAGAIHARSYKKRTNSATTAPRKPAVIVVPTGLEQVHTDLMAYSGTFGFVLDLRSKLCKYGKLSDKQWEAAKKCLTPKPVADPNEVLVDSCNVPIVVSATSARHIAKSVGWSMNPTTLVVTQIKNRDRRGFTATIKADWTGSVSVCRCCGKSLTDWRSQATGVGPVCVKGTGIQYVRNQQDVARFQKEMQDLCQKMGEVEVYIKGWHVKEGMHMIDSIASTATPKKVVATASPILQRVPTTTEVNITDLQWDDKTRTFTGDWKKLRSMPNFPMPDSIKVYNHQTQREVMFKERVKGSARYASNDLGYAIYLMLI
jgi:hypothetical protein